MQGMDSNSDSMKQMAEMCMRMMKSEKAAMPYIIGISVLFGLLLFVVDGFLSLGHLRLMGRLVPGPDGPLVVQAATGIVMAR